MPDETRIAMIGAGRMAEAHLKAFLAHAGVVCTGIYSRTPQRAVALAHRYGCPPVYTSLADLYGQGKPHGVIIAVSCPCLSEVTRAAMDYDWTILMEKPPGLTPSETETLLTVQRRCRRRVFVGMNRRFIGVMRRAREALEHAGGAQVIHVQDTQDLSLARQYHEPEIVMRHWMYANSIHTIDLLRYFGGDVAGVKVLRPWTCTYSGTVLAAIEFARGASGIYEGFWESPGPWAVTAVAPGVRCELRPLEKLLLWRAGAAPEEITVPTEDRHFKPGLYAQAGAFLRAIHRKPASGVGLTDLADAMLTMRLIRKIYAVSR
jgi:predicted dehydrogenase